MKPARLCPALLALGLSGLFCPGSSPRPSARAQAVRENPDATLSPYFWVQSADPAVDRLPLKSTSAKVSIAGVIADVKVTQVYANEGRRPLEAVYVFPGSTRAAVYGMTMILGERRIQAHIRGKEEARQAYETARQQGRSASLLEQHRPNVFQMSVANILPGDRVQVELSYTELLVPEHGTCSFVYPTVVGPRYSNTPAAGAPASERWVANPYTHAGVDAKYRFDMEVRLAAGMPLHRVACDTHRTHVAYEGPSVATVKLDPSECFCGNKDYILKYQLADQRIQSGLLLYPGKDENFFLLMVQPPGRPRPEAIPPREYVFIMDVSGSMGGYPIETSKTLMRNLVGHLRPQDRFNILVFESGSALWSEAGSLPATRENLERALAFVGAKSGGGGTEILSALGRALALPRTRGMSRTFVIATDGYINVEPRVLDLVRQNLGDANMFAFGIGTSVNRHLIEGIAHAGMGEPFVITRPEEAAAQAERFRQYVASPVLTSVKAEFKGFQAYDVEPLHMPDVLAERPVLLFGKWRGEPEGRIEVSGLSGDGAYRQSFDVGQVRPSSANAALRFLWARHRIQLLGDYGQLGNPEAQKAAITALGLKYGLLTNYTSFVAVDSQVRNPGGKNTQVNQPLPMPEGVPDSAVGGRTRALAPATMAAPALSRADKVQVAREEAKPKELFLAPAPRVASSAPAMAPGIASRPSQAPPAPAVPAVPMTTARLPRILSLTAAPSARLTPALRQSLEQALRDPGLADLLKGLPAETVLEVKLDARGKVLAASFSRAFQGSDKALDLIRRWNLATPGAAGLRITLGV